MGPETGKKLRRDIKRNEASVQNLHRQKRQRSVHEDKGKEAGLRHFPDCHAGLYENEDLEGEGRSALFEQGEREKGPLAKLPDKTMSASFLPQAKHSSKTGPLKKASRKKKAPTEEGIRSMLSDTTEEMRDFLQPEKRTGAELKSVRDKLSNLEEALSELAGEPGGLPAEYRQLLKDVRIRKKQLDRVIEMNIPVNPEALRSFEEAQAGIGAGDAAELLVSGMLESYTKILTGQAKSVDGKSTEDLTRILNEINAMGSRTRHTKEQQSLGIMEKESMGNGFAQSNRVLQEANETKHGSRVRRETGEGGESEELFEKRKGEEERDALGKKYQILKSITKANRNNLRQKQSSDGLEAVCGMMHNGERDMGYAPLPAMGLGGNLYKGLTGMNFMMSLDNAAVDKQRKRMEIKGVTERYLGLDSLYRNFMTKNIDLRNRTAFLKRYGMEGNVRVMIRKEQDKALGIGSENRMNSLVMQQYARELWKRAFLKEDGQVITERERKSEAADKKQQRKLYADMLRAMGFNVRYPDAEGEKPGVSAVEIFKRLSR